MGRKIGRDGHRRASGAAREFAAVIAHWRRLRGLNQQQLADLINFHSSYVSHIESLRHRPTEQFAERAERMLAADGAILASWERYRAQANEPAPAAVPPRRVRQIEVAAEESWHRLAGGRYETTVRRLVVNNTDTPLVRMALAVPPGQLADDGPDATRWPPGWADLDLRAVADGRALDFEPERYRDGLLEGWLLFRNGTGRFEVEPGARVRVEYSYRVPAGWCRALFERYVSMPTGQLTAHLQFSHDDEPARVWGTVVTPSGDRPSPAPPDRVDSAAGVEYRCTVVNPVVGHTYRWEWLPARTERVMTPAA